MFYIPEKYSSGPDVSCRAELFLASAWLADYQVVTLIATAQCNLLLQQQPISTVN